METHPRTRLAASLAILMLALGSAPLARGQSPSPQTAAPIPPGSGAMAPGTSAPRTAPGTASVEPGSTPGTPAAPGSTAAGAAPGGAANPEFPTPATGAGSGVLDGAAGAAPGAGAGAGGALSSGLGGTLGSGGSSYFGMIGDAPPNPRLQAFARPINIPQPPPLPRPGVPPVPPRFPAQGRAFAQAVLPSVQQLKISENQSPQPQDRIYTTFNYFNNLNEKVDRTLRSPIHDVQLYRYVIGAEKTFLDGDASIGLRLPIHTLTSTSSVAGYGGTSTAVGDLAAIFKYAFARNRDTGSLASVGLMVSMPTGPQNFAGARGFVSFRNTGLTPFIGYVINRDRAYLQGFSSIDIPTDKNASTVIYNDLGVGYYLYRAPDTDRFLTGIAPTFEVHVNTPVNHRGIGGPGNVLNGSYDIVNLTLGSNFLLGKRGVLTLGVVDPVTGPRPFAIETVVQFNYRF